MERRITEAELRDFAKELREEEREASTIEKYLRDIRQFVRWLKEQPLSKELAVKWKESLIDAGYHPATVNSMLSALNRFFRFLGRENCRVKYLRVQRRIFRSTEKELTREEYFRLLDTAQQKGRERLALLMETICATGIRVSEVKYITVSAVEKGSTEIALKGKVRTILIPGKLCKKLKKYARKQKIASGEIFLTKSGKGLSRMQIWTEMKAVCKEAKVARSKVFPHNLRHCVTRSAA